MYITIINVLTIKENPIDDNDVDLLFQQMRECVELLAPSQSQRFDIRHNYRNHTVTMIYI